ncbi:hypothetical protein DFP72DRAFT_786807, partial [Ephemerocybe angulata]
MVSRCRSKVWIVQLREDRYTNREKSQTDLSEEEDSSRPGDQRGFRGNIVIYPQDPTSVAATLPPKLEDLTNPVAVVFVGSHAPTNEWLKKKAKPLCIRPARVRAALEWLKQNNSLYHDIDIDYDVLNAITDDEIVLPVKINVHTSSSSTDVVTSRYDNVDNPDAELEFGKTIITNISDTASPSQLRIAATRHVKNLDGGHIQVPHGVDPVNEFANPSLFPMMYPTLYPYGLGGFEISSRSSRLSLIRHARHL